MPRLPSRSSLGIEIGVHKIQIVKGYTLYSDVPLRLLSHSIWKKCNIPFVPFPVNVNPSFGQGAIITIMFSRRHDGSPSTLPEEVMGPHLPEEAMEVYQLFQKR